MMLRSEPSFTIRALPNGIIKSVQDSPSGCRLAIKMFVLEEHDRVVAADRRAQKAATSSALEGITTRRPGQWAKIDSPLWL